MYYTVFWISGHLTVDKHLSINKIGHGKYIIAILLKLQIVAIFIFLAFDFCRFCMVICSIPTHHNGQ